ncbi:MAG: sigma-70 family RNA polymerase sigma factor [Candidatus Omnitrophica bacterium]|nr:sigma-70 family RNA polymerase sigma factor [Candidatus Omnitrophota bacterium]
MRTDQELIRGVKRHDPGLFEELVRRFQQRVYFTALRMLGERDDALDAAQEVFLKIWRFAPKLSESILLERWVYRIAVNTCIDRLRSLKIYEHKQTHDNLVFLSLVEPSMNPREYAKRMEELHQVKKALRELTDRQRAIFVLRHFQNLKMQEIADIMSMPLGTVKATLHQAFSKLQGFLKKAHADASVSRSKSCSQTG